MSADVARVARVLGMLGPVAAEAEAPMCSIEVREGHVPAEGPAPRWGSDGVRLAVTEVKFHVFGYDAAVRLVSVLGLPEVSRKVHGGGEAGWGPSEHTTWRSVVVLDAGVVAQVEVLVLRDVAADDVTVPAAGDADVPVPFVLTGKEVA